MSAHPYTAERALKHFHMLWRTVAEENRWVTQMDFWSVINACKAEGGECGLCAVILCPHQEPMHLHHDGCPACTDDR